MAASLAAALPPAATAAEFDMAQLIALLSGTRSGVATFTERRQVAMLDRTLESSGRLTFEAPDTFVRETLEPRAERIAVVGNTLTMSQGQRSRSVALDSAPEAGVIVEAIRGTLTGNRETLERLFTTHVSGTAEHWSLELVPREVRLREQVARVRIAGERARVSEVRIEMPDGDRTVMTIQPLPAGTTPPQSSAGTTPASPPAASAAR